ncbi:MAG: hypothetical protein EBZ48_13840, partial [Proteobacteria bacterium]|nr:hypothetical protein [Pseudomonadota bacterium]
LQREERLQELGAALSAPHAGPSSCRETSELAVAAMTLKTALRPSSELSWPALISNLGELVRLNVELGLQRERQNQRLENAVIDGRCAQSRADTFKARLEDERAKNIVARLIRSSTCKRISELEQRARARSESLRATSERLHAEQSELVKLSANLQQELQTLTKEAAVRILREVVGHFSTIQKQLQESAVIKVLDDTLVKTNLLPALDQEAIPPAERSKIIDFVTRYLLADGPPVSFNEAPIYHRRLNEYNDLRSQLRPEVDLESITDTVSLRHYINSPLPRHFYRDQFALLCSAGARYEVNNVTNALHALGIAVPEPSEYQANDKYQSSRHGFQLDAVYLDTAKLLQGLERWKVIRETPGLPELFSPGVFEATTQILTERLHREDLVPGGRESTAGTVAAFKMVQLGSLRAIPYFVEHLKLHGAGHTSAVVAHQLLSMWSSLSDDQKTQCREVIGRNDFRALELLASPSSFLNRIARPDSYYQASVVHDPSTFLIKERLVGILERNPEFSEEQVGAFYREFKFNSSKVLQAFLAERKEVEKLIAGERLDFWTRGYPALLTALCDPRNGVLTLPRTIAIDGMGVSDSNALETLERVVTSDRFCKSGFDRKALVEGIVFLNTREDGGKILL